MIPAPCGQKVLTPSSISPTYTIATLKKPIRTFFSYRQNWTFSRRYWPFFHFYGNVFIVPYAMLETMIRITKERHIDRKKLYFTCRHNKGVTNPNTIHVIDHTRVRKIYNSGSVERSGPGLLENLDASRVAENLVDPVIYQRERIAIAWFRNPRNQSGVARRTGVSDNRSA